MRRASWFLVEHRECAQVTFVLDGRPWPNSMDGVPSASSARIALQRDTERHLLTCVVDGEVHRRFGRAPGTLARGTRGPTRTRSSWLRNGHPGKQQRPFCLSCLAFDGRMAGPDMLLRGLAARLDVHPEDTRQALHHEAQRLAALVAALRRQDLHPDYARKQAPELDVIETLEGLRHNPNYFPLPRMAPSRWVTPAIQRTPSFGVWRPSSPGRQHTAARDGIGAGRCT